MELEADIEPVKVRLNKKCRKYALRVIILPENHPVRQRTPHSYPPEEISGQEIPIELNYLDWNQNSHSQKHSTQLIRVLNSISTLIPTGAKIEDQSTINTPWQKTTSELADLNISKEDKEVVTKKHLIQIRQLAERNIPIFYTDGSKLKQTNQGKSDLGAEICHIQGKNTNLESYFLDYTQKVIDAELHAISQAIKWITESETRKRNFWIFTDSQSAIQKLQKEYIQTEVHQNIIQNLEKLKNQDKNVHIHWVPSHTYIPGNELADKAAKKGARNTERAVINASKTQTSLSFIKKDIDKIAQEEWTQYWRNAKQGQQYSKLQTEPEGKVKSKELKQADRLTFSTFTQIKLEHEYFKSYLERLPAYEDNLCHICKVKQTLKHILISCKQYKAEQKKLKNTVLRQKAKPGTGANSELSLKRLLCTGEGIKATLAFLKETKIATRK